MFYVLKFRLATFKLGCFTKRKMATYKHYLNVRITDSEMAKLIELKTEKNQSSSQIIRSLIREKK